MSHTKKHPYTKAKAVSKQCRNGGKCIYCQQNRTYKNEKHIVKIEIPIYFFNHNHISI